MLQIFGEKKKFKNIFKRLGLGGKINCFECCRENNGNETKSEHLNNN